MTQVDILLKIHKTDRNILLESKINYSKGTLPIIVIQSEHFYSVNASCPNKLIFFNL